MRGKTEKIDQIIKNVFLKKGITNNLQLNRIKKAISSQIKEEEKSYIRVSHIKNKKLFIFIKSSSLLYEIKCFKKDDILQSIREEGGIYIDDVCFMMDSDRDE